MANWGGLNNALTAWRDAYRRRFPNRGTASDGARADALHGSSSQHQEDADRTIDANDMDVNLLGSAEPAGTPAERRLIEAMKLDFEQDPHGRSQLWIHQREIANRSIGPWRRRDYDGPNPHDKHVHWESRQSREDDGREWPMPHTDALLREMGRVDMEWTDKPWRSAEPISAADALQQASRADEAVKEVQSLRSQVSALDSKVGTLSGKLDELLSRVPDNTPAQRLDK